MSPVNAFEPLQADSSILNLAHVRGCENETKLQADLKIGTMNLGACSSHEK